MALPLKSKNVTVRSNVPRQETASPLGQVGDWQLVHQIAMGPYAETFLARPAAVDLARQAMANEALSCSYVVKRLREVHGHDAHAVEMIRREAMVGNAVTHPHLVTVLDAQVDDAPYYIVMPRLIGMTLREKLGIDCRIAVPMALWVARQIAEAMAALHERDWLHADIKPANISVAPDGHATLLDLGFCRRWCHEGSAVEDTIRGTFLYIAPETVTSSVATDRRSDIYSLGATLYEILSGTPPFAASTLADLARMHREAKPRCLRQCVPEIPKPVARLVHRMLAKEPLRRPQSAPELVRELIALEIDSLMHAA